MSENTPRAIVLCEDRSHWHFIRAYLIARGWNARQLFHRIAPNGEGAAERWVIDKYPEELRAYRAKKHENLVFVVMIDGDRYSCGERIAYLNDERRLAECGMEARTAGERVGIFVPCRNIETWMVFLEGESVDEQKDYKSLVKISPSEAARGLAAMCQNGWPADREVPVSLSAACHEWSRLEGLN